MVWSFSDLLMLRLIDWLRQDKGLHDEVQFPPVSVKRIREELARAEHVSEATMDESVEVFVDARGRLRFAREHSMWIELGEDVAQQVMESAVNLLLVPSWQEGHRGPNLRTPRPTLRIVPGKLSGEPHVARTRIPTDMISALANRGFEPLEIVELYPRLTEVAIEEAIDLERQLADNLRSAA
jgi:uncharacterized protein (DUF433 family)